MEVVSGGCYTAIYRYSLVQHFSPTGGFMGEDKCPARKGGLMVPGPAAAVVCPRRVVADQLLRPRAAYWPDS